MIKNYFKIAWRNLIKNKGYSAINIGGLAVGMAVAMLIGLWINDELSFNKYHHNYDRIAQVMVNQDDNGDIKTWKSVPYPYINEIKTNYSENFKHIIASTDAAEYVLTAGEKKLAETGLFIESEAPEMFTLKMLKGSLTGLNDMQSILLSESSAKALFGDTDPINQVVKINIGGDLKVTGVYEDLPQNTQLHNIQFLSSWDYYVATNRFMKEKKWDNHALWMFVEIKPNTDFDKATASIKNSELNAIKNLDNMKDEAATHPQMWLHPMNRWHLYSNFKKGTAANGPVQYVWMVGMIGFFVLLLACINFMNLSTARCEKRAKEVGIRKAIGSLRGQLIRQFFGESFLVVLIAFAIAFLMVAFSLPWFNDLAAKRMTMPWSNIYFWLLDLGFILVTALLAGSYPAIYLSSFQPVKVLKGTFKVGRFAAIPRKTLVVTQFTVSVALIICTIIVDRQVQFAKKRPVGYTREGLLLVKGSFPGKSDILRTELKNTGMVTEVAESQSPVTGVWSQNYGFNWRGKLPGQDIYFATLTVSSGYGKTVGWQFIDGRDFSKEFASDSSGFIINETAARLTGFQHPVGEIIKWKNSWMTNGIEKNFQVIGVVKDMVMESPFETVKPTVFFLKGFPNWTNIKINPNVSMSEALPKIGAVFKKLLPDVLFDYKFADEEYARKFGDEERTGKLTTFFAVLAILISCLGLLGLASYVAEQRTKEIGIRKVVGASVFNLWQMLSKDFVVLVIISCLIAVPVTYYFMSSWLQKYQYRTNISWWIFAAALGGALLITLLTVSFQAIKAAIANPVKSLRTE